MSRILYVVTRSIMGGAQRHVLELVKGFRDRHDITVATGDQGFLTDELDALGVRWRVIEGMQRAVNPMREVAAIRNTRKLIRELRPDIVHAHSTKAGLIARIAARREGTRSIYSIHGWAFDPGVSLGGRALVWPVEALAAPLSDVLLFSSRHDRDYGRSRLPIGGKASEVVPYGMEAEVMQATPGEAARPRVTMAARFSDQKDQPTLLRAAAMLKDLDFELDLVGDGPNLERDKALAAELGLGDTVRFLGTRHDLEALLAKSHAFVLTTNHEGLPLVVMEAMRAGLPVVATDVSGVSEEVDEGSTGFLVERGDHRTVADRLRRLIEDPALRERMGEAARKKFLAEFTRARMVAGIGALYDRMTGTAPKAPKTPRSSRASRAENAA